MNSAPSQTGPKLLVLDDATIQGRVTELDFGANLSVVVSGQRATITGSAGAGAALTRVNDTNVSLTLGGSPATALLAASSLTLGWLGQLGLARGGTNADLSATGGASQVLRQSGVGAAVTVSQLTAADIGTGQALTRVNDTNVTLTLGGTPATALLAASSLTLGWTGLLGLARGGTNADLSATGGASQVLRQSSGGAAVTVSQLTAADIGSGAALTRVSDTNVTLTLGGTPSTALLVAASLTLGWTGTLGVVRGGSGADMSGTGGAGFLVKQTSVGGAFTAAALVAGDISAGLIDHNAKLTNFTANDNHTQYALLAGRSGGQTLSGDTAASGALLLQGTASGTKGPVKVDDRLRQVGVAGNPAALTDGDYWYNTTQKSHRFESTVGVEGLVGTVVAAVADSTAISNTLTETAFSNGSFTFPANSVTAGKTVRVKAWGKYSTSLTPTMQWNLRWGSVNTDPILCGCAADTEAVSGASALPWWAEFIFTVRTTGASGTANGACVVMVPTSATTFVAQNELNNTVTNTTIDTTASKQMTLFFKWGAAVAGNTVTLLGFVVEVLD